jgi:hypothetical protein
MKLTGFEEPDGFSYYLLHGVGQFFSCPWMFTAKYMVGFQSK